MLTTYIEIFNNNDDNNNNNNKENKNYNNWHRVLMCQAVLQTFYMC